MKIINYEDIKNATQQKRTQIMIDIINGKVKVEKDMGKINLVETRVKELLENIPSTRNSDELLYATYIETYHYTNLTRDTFINYKQYDLPSFKTVERIRRNLQDKEKHIEADQSTQDNRKYAEQEYRERYSK